ncbi:hypothetical protein [Limobrevibacterium gyesilva]|uniref:HNH endonuclease n=1 Tax=Limobrevibacterium gyesilva TaxID=2991712 RepID=A0AA41YW32_9PROT|nr:hypothetical protein [Limobrevibacterium gyesilva]MCW3477548.1 hypothetical protein [Limobrevibacterium gyesilva]
MAKGGGAKQKAGSAKEEAKRLQPSREVLRNLYLLSGNNCAMPGCEHVLINNAGTMVGKICHIEAAERGGPRFRKDMSNEERRAAANLILLCSPHHDVIDDMKNVADWPVKRLKEIKRQHEDTFREVGETLAKAFRAQFQDSTATTAVQKAKSLARLLAHSTYSDLTTKQVKAAQKGLDAFADRLQNVPQHEREFMLAIVQRAIRLRKKSTAAVNVYDVQSALGLAHETIKKYGEALERYEVGGIVEADENQYEMQIYDPSDYVGWIDLAGFCADEGIDLRQIIVERRLNLLD